MFFTDSESSKSIYWNTAQNPGINSWFEDIFYIPQIWQFPTLTG
jgi:hypothetical protein